MPADDKPKWLLVGAGDIAAKRVAAALAGSGSGSGIRRAVAVCDIARERRRRSPANSAPPKYTRTSTRRSPRLPRPPSTSRRPSSSTPSRPARSSSRGATSSSEKPLGLGAADATQAAEAARHHPDLTAGCAYFRRCSARYAHARNMLERGEFGRIVLVRMTYFSCFNPAPDTPRYWRVVPAKSGGGVLADMGSHMFDVLIGLLGLPAGSTPKPRRSSSPTRSRIPPRS